MREKLAKRDKIIRRGHFRKEEGYLWLLQRLILGLILLNNFIKVFVQNRYELMKLIVEIMLKGILCVVGDANIIQEELNDLEDWTFKIEENLIYLCIWLCTFTL